MKKLISISIEIPPEPPDAAAERILRRKLKTRQANRDVTLLLEFRDSEKPEGEDTERHEVTVSADGMDTFRGYLALTFQQLQRTFGPIEEKGKGHTMTIEIHNTTEEIVKSGEKG